MSKFNKILRGMVMMFPMAIGINAAENDFEINLSKIFPIQNEPFAIKIVHDNTMNVKNLEGKFYLNDNLIGKKNDDNGTLELIFTPKENGKAEIRVDLSYVNDGKEINITKTKSVVIIAKPLYFPWWIQETSAASKISNLNMVLSKSEDAYWKSRGVLPCIWKGANSDSPEAYSDYLKKDYRPGCGIMIDEIGWYSPNPKKQNAIDGLKIFTQQNPDIKTFVYICGSLKPQFCNIVKRTPKDTGADLLMLESYFDYQIPDLNTFSRYKYFEQRINMARDYDVLDRSIMILGICEIKYKYREGEIEEQFIYIRKNAPEMPGIGFYKVVDEKLYPLIDNLCWKYFIAPVVTVWDRDIFLSNYAPEKGKEIRISADVYNIGAIDAKNVELYFYYRGSNGKKNLIGKQQIPLIAANPAAYKCRQNVAVEWKPEESGYYDISVEIHCIDKSVTILNATAQKGILVQ